MDKQLNPLVISLYMIIYKLLWLLLLPVILGYLFWRSLKDSDYRRCVMERFGYYRQVATDTVWIHAVSLGEMRSAEPIIKKLLEQDHKVVCTHFTPAGKRAAKQLFKGAIANNKLYSVYVPFEWDFVYQRFFLAFQPKFGLVMEVETWPTMIISSKRQRVPLFLCNGQYPKKSYDRDIRKFKFRAYLTTEFAGIFAKSNIQAERFKSLGINNIAITGEMRFEQKIPKEMIQAAQKIMENQQVHRPTIAFVSVVEGEDLLYFEAIKRIMEYVLTNNLERPFIIYVPRKPERFDDVAQMLKKGNIKYIKRSESFDDRLSLLDTNIIKIDDVDCLLGDSLGEMYFYLELSDVVVVGGSFHPTGSHNIIEPLSIKKRVFVGPHIWTIEYPAIEAIEAKVLIKVNTIEELSDKLCATLYNLKYIESNFEKLAEKFNDEQSGCVDKTLQYLPKLLANTTYI